MRDNQYVDFEEGEQERFLRSVKKEKFNTWREMYEFLDVSRSMMYFYLSEEHKIPISSFNKLSDICSLDESNFSYDLVQFPHSGEVPKTLNWMLAEFIGILLGDGCIYETNYGIGIICGEIDGDYIHSYVPALIRGLFRKKPRIDRIKDKGVSIRCYFYSKSIAQFLVETFGIPTGKKLEEKLKIPTIFYEHNQLLKACIRGLIDTDGGVHRHHENSIQLQFANRSESLVESLQRALEYLGYTPSISYREPRDTYNVYLFGEEVEKYLEEIGSSNPKNQVKYSLWQEEGKMPLNSEIENYVAKKII